MTNNTPQKRLTINNNTIKEIHSAYPPQESVTGKTYKATLEYITTEIDFFEEHGTKELIKSHGLAPIGFYELLRIEIANSNGYGVCISNDDFKVFIFKIGLKLNIDEETVNNYLKLLTEYKLLYKIKDEDTNMEYYTTLQSVWNYEYRLYYRYSNREKQKKSRQRKKKADTIKNEVEKVDTSKTVPVYCPSDYSDIDFGDLPFEDFDNT